jgi:hypothetical protein
VDEGIATPEEIDLATGGSDSQMGIIKLMDYAGLAFNAFSALYEDTREARSSRLPGCAAWWLRICRVAGLERVSTTNLQMTTFDIPLIHRSSTMLNVSSPAVIIGAAEGA